MNVISTVTRTRAAKETAMGFLAASWRPVTAVLEQRQPSPREQSNPSLWPVADTHSNRIRFEGSARGFERAWQMVTLKWLAIRLGTRRYFPAFELPLRKGPSTAKVPFWTVNQQDCPLLVDHDWRSDQLHNDIHLPPRLYPHVVDRLGLPSGPGPNAQNFAPLEDFHEDASFGQCIREELARLDVRLRDNQ